MKYLNLEITKDEIAVLSIDCPGSRVNTISTGLVAEVSAVIDSVEKNDRIKALIVLSAKEDNFFTGVDLHELQRMNNLEELKAYMTKGHAILNRIETMKIPVIACIHGNCIGGGLEIAISCHYRIGADSPDTVFASPEVQVGLLPDSAGVLRLPELIGLTHALDMMLTGRAIRAKKAAAMGLIDELVPPCALKETALKRAAGMIKSGKIRHKRKQGIIQLLLESNPPGRALIFAKARKMVLRRTYGCYPSPLAALDTLSYSYKKGKRAGLENAIEIFSSLAVGFHAKALMSLVTGMMELKKNPLRNIARRTGKLAVTGTGLMGREIAAVSTSTCDIILMKDIDPDASAKGMEEIWKWLVKGVESGALPPGEREVRYGKLVPCHDYRMFMNTDLVIEAVFEDLALKRKILSEVESATGGETIFTSNTSAIPIADIARGCRWPENVIGMHYFSPVTKMPLLEIIVTPQTAQRTRASALELGIAQGKTCIVVKDGPGFYTTRILAPMLNELMLLLEEGAVPDDIDTAMRQFGYAAGPAALIDEAGIDVAAHVAEELGPLFIKRGNPVSKGIPLLFAEGYRGRKNKKGIYRYDLKKKKGFRIPDKKVYVILGSAPRRKFSKNFIQERLSLMMVNEALLCLEEGIISSPRDGDIGAVLGLGFPPFHGGPFRYIDNTGAGTVIDSMNRLELKYGSRFRPAGILADMAKSGGKFYKY